MKFSFHHSPLIRRKVTEWSMSRTPTGSGRLPRSSTKRWRARTWSLPWAFFSDDCEIQMLGLTLKGKKEAKKWLKWLFSTFEEISFEPVTIMVEGDTFFEEFVIDAVLPDGRRIRSKQSEVLVYEDYKVKSLRIYFDRLDFADLIGTGPVRRKIVKMLREASLKDLK
ncbi:MAG: nuclear transport factor 2 family protein [Thermoplasmatota archaeon]